MYSASQDERATVFCRLDAQDIRLPASEAEYMVITEPMKGGLPQCFRHSWIFESSCLIDHKLLASFCNAESQALFAES